MSVWMIAFQVIVNSTHKKIEREEFFVDDWRLPRKQTVPFTLGILSCRREKLMIELQVNALG